MPGIKAVGIIAKPGIAHASDIVSELLRWLARHDIQARFDAETVQRYVPLVRSAAREISTALGWDGAVPTAQGRPAGA